MTACSPSLDDANSGRTMIGDAVFRCWRPSHCLPAGGTRERDTDPALCPDQYSRCVLGCHFGSYRQPGTRFVLPAVKILLTGAASESTVVTEPATPGNQSIRGHDRVYLYKWK